MTVAVDVVDSTGLVTDRDAVKALVQAVLEAEEVSGEVVVAFVHEAAIAELNERYRHADGPTDVLSFGEGVAGEWSGEAEVCPVVGEIVVCPEVIVRYAREDGRDTGTQLGWTLIHGALHLAGYDHETDHGEMREREQNLLRRLEECAGRLSVDEDRSGRETGT